MAKLTKNQKLAAEKIEAGMSPGNQSGANLTFPIRPAPEGRLLEFGIFIKIMATIHLCIMAT